MILDCGNHLCLDKINQRNKLLSEDKKYFVLQKEEYCVAYLEIKKINRTGPNARDRFYAYGMILPVLVGFFLLLFGPLLYSGYLSLTDTTMLKEGEFVGLQNYQMLFTKDKLFGMVIGNSLYFMMGVVPLNIVFSLLMAGMLNTKIRMVGFFRTMAFTPVITSIVVWSVVWKYILAVDYGIVNGFLEWIGLERINWFYSKTLTMPMLIVTTVIKGMGQNMVIFLSAMKSLPETYFEAAKIDGASGRRMFVHITLPLISSSVFLGVITTCIGALKIFGNVYTMTGGGPANKTSVMVYYIYKLAFQQNRLGYASSVAMVLFIMVLALTIVQWNMRRRVVYNEV